MAATVRQTLEGAGLGNQVLTAGAETQVGDALVATQTWTAGNAVDMAQPSPGTWVSAALADVGDGQHKIRIWVRTVTVAGEQAITIPAQSEFAGLHARLRVVAGADPLDPIIDGTGAVGFTSPGALAAPSADGLADALLACDWTVDNDGMTFTAPPAGMTASGVQTTDFLASYGAHQTLAADGATGTRTPTVTDGGSWAASSVTIRGASAAAVAGSGVGYGSGLSEATPAKVGPGSAAAAGTGFSTTSPAKVGGGTGTGHGGGFATATPAKMGLGRGTGSGGAHGEAVAAKVGTGVGAGVGAGVSTAQVSTVRQTRTIASAGALGRASPSRTAPGAGVAYGAGYGLDSPAVVVTPGILTPGFTRPSLTPGATRPGLTPGSIRPLLTAGRLPGGQ